MANTQGIPIVRCHLDGPEGLPAILRYVPLIEFELWRHLMRTRHRREVTVEEVSIWIPEEAGLREQGYAVEDLEPVLRLHIDLSGPHDVAVPVERFLPAETYPQARTALMAHFAGRALRCPPTATPGYVVPARTRTQEKTVA